MPFETNAETSSLNILHLVTADDARCRFMQALRMLNIVVLRATSRRAVLKCK